MKTMSHWCVRKQTLNVMRQKWEESHKDGDGSVIKKRFASDKLLDVGCTPVTPALGGWRQGTKVQGHPSYKVSSRKKRERKEKKSLLVLF